MTALRIALGLVFVGAGALKSAQPVATVMGVGAYGLLPAPVALLGGLILPGLEIAVGASLLAGVLVRPAAIWASLLAFLFTLFVGWATVRGLDVSCGCFGPLSFADRAGPGILLFDVALLVASTAIWRRAPPK
jgi:uncharacterized membrane protein YphA (DoxX/SURF4 family)